MKLNRWEFLLMNNAARAISQRRVEWPLMRRGAALPRGGRVLEIGCGRGVGAEILLNALDPRSYHGIDLDERMVALAESRVRDPRASFKVASATDLPFESGTFDGAFDFGILHHIPDFPKALAEIFRILRPGGQFILEDLSIEFFNFPLTRIFKVVLDHPYDSMYRAPDFREACGKTGFVTERWLSPSGLFIMAQLRKPQAKSSAGR